MQVESRHEDKLDDNQQENVGLMKHSKPRKWVHFSKKLQVVQAPKCSIILFSKLATSEVYFLCQLPREVSSLWSVKCENYTLEYA